MFFKEHKNIVLLFAGVLGQNHLERFSEIKNRIFRGDDGIGAAPRLAAAHRAADTNAPGGRLNQTPGEGACVSFIAACAVLRPPAPSITPPDMLVPAKGQADRAVAWAHGVTGTRAPGGCLTYTLGEMARALPGAFGGV